MIARKFSVIFLALILAFTLAACGGDDDDNDGGDSDGGGNANLSQTITSDQFGAGTLTVNYPEGWAATEEFGSVSVANSQDALNLIGASEAPGGEVPEDQVGGNVSFVPAEATASLGSSASAIAIALTSGMSGVTMGDPQEFTINGKNAAAITGDGTVSGLNISTTAIAVQEGDGYVVGIFIARQGELDQFEDSLRAIVGFASLTLAAGGELPTDEAATETAP